MRTQAFFSSLYPDCAAAEDPTLRFSFGNCQRGEIVSYQTNSDSTFSTTGTRRKSPLANRRELLIATAAVAGLMGARVSHAQTMTPITLTGFNQDIIAEAAPAASTTTAAFDAYNNYALVASGYPGLADTGENGLPANGLFTSQANSSTTFQLASYTANNALLFNTATNAPDAPQVSAGTLTLSSPNAFTNLAFLSAAANNNSTDVINYTLNFSDGSTLPGTLTGTDWFNGGTTVAIDELSRVDRTGDSPEDNYPNPNLYEDDLAIPTADQTKILTSVSFSTTGNGFQWAMMGISGAANGNGLPTLTWNGNVNGSLDLTTPNFQGSVAFSQYDSIIFDDTASGTTSVVVQGAGIIASNVTFNNNAKSYTITGGAIAGAGGLTVGGGGSVTLGNSDTFNGATNITSGSLTIAGTGSLSTSSLYVNSGTSFTVQSGGTISGLTGTPLALTGSGAITLTGATLTAGAGTSFTGSFSGTGSLNLSAGTVTVSSPTQLALTGGVTVGSSNTSTASLIINDQSGQAGLVNGAPITVTLSGTGPIGLSAGTPIIGNAGALRGPDGGTGVFAGNVVVAPAGATISGGSGGTLTVSGTISGSGPLVLGSDGGSTTILTAANTYTGQTTFGGDSSAFDQATLQLGHNNALGTGAGGLALTSAAGLGVLDLHGFNQSFGTLSGGGANTTVTNLGSTPSVLTINGTSGSGVFSSAINDGNSKISVIKTGAGSQAFTGSSTYSGGTTVSGGVLTASSLNALGTGPVTMSGGTLNLSVGAGNQSGFGGLKLNGTATINNGNLQLTDGGPSEAGSAFSTSPVIISNAVGFTASFNYVADGGADGITFGIQNDPRGSSAVGGPGGMLGYGGITNSASVQLNLYQGSLGFGTDGTISDSDDQYDIGIGYSNDVTLVYDGNAKTLTETIDDEFGDTLTNVYSVDFNSVLNGKVGYVGFTGGSGQVTAVQTISNFNFSDGGLTSATSIANAITTAPHTSSVLTASVVTSLNTATIGALTLTTGSKLTVTSTSSSLNTHLVLTTPSLSISGTTGNWTGLLDLTNNSLDVQNGNLATITNQVKQGYANGTWQGSGGITSSTAAADPAHLTALGVILNADNSGNQLYGSGGALGLFDGANPAASDVLVKLTYYGDTDLSGTVDGSDYSRIDNAFAVDKTSPGSLTGWFNGDFNYDGVIDGSDYTLIDNAFNQQGASLAAQVATATATIGTTAVPEPATLGLLAIGAAGMLGRRRRTR